VKLTLYAIRIFTYDWSRALDFYRSVLELPEVFANAESGWAEFSVGSAHIGIERVSESDPEGSALVGRFLGVSLRVDDIESTYSTLVERGVKFLSPPARQPWGGSLAHFEDPDGNVLTLLG
jgi:lactoylglutathione lyase